MHEIPAYHVHVYGRVYCGDSVLEKIEHTAIQWNNVFWYWSRYL